MATATDTPSAFESVPSPCPRCGEHVQKRLTICPSCGAVVAASRAAEFAVLGGIATFFALAVVILRYCNLG